MAFAILHRLIAATSLCLIAYLPVKAEQDIYAVSGVPVDVTAETVIAAREKAVAQGQREGLRRLLQRLTVPEYYSLLPDVAGIDMTRLVKSFGVENEQLSADRYIAEVGSTYDGAGVQQLLRGRGIPIVLAGSAPLLVVPARRVDGRLLMFEAGDPWTEAWNRGASRNTLLDVVLPLGDLLDISKLPSNATGAAIDAGLLALAERYNARSAILLLAEGEEVAGSSLTIASGPAVNWSHAVSSFSLDGGVENVWNQAVVGSLRRMEVGWKTENLVRFDSVEQMTVSAPLVDLASWAHIQTTLAAVPEIQKTELRSFSQRQAILRIRFIGGLAQLQRSFQNRGLRLVEETGQWLLQRAGSQQAG